MAYEQQKLGMRIIESLDSLHSKMASLDLHFFVTIIKINSESGGNFRKYWNSLPKRSGREFRYAGRSMYIPQRGACPGISLSCCRQFCLAFSHDAPRVYERVFQGRAQPIHSRLLLLRWHISDIGDQANHQYSHLEADLGTHGRIHSPVGFCERRAPSGAAGLPDDQ